MKDENKTKAQLILELEDLRRRVAEFEIEKARRERTDLALEESEERYRSVVDGAPSSVLAIQDGRVAFINPAGARMLGYNEPEEILGKPALDFVSPGYRKLVAERIGKLEKGKANPPIEIELMRSDGTTRIVESTSIPIMLQEKPAAVIIGQDITETKERDRILRQTQFIMEHAIDAILWVSPNGRMAYANKAACLLLGYTREELLYLDVSAIDPNTPLDVWIRDWKEYRKRGFFLVTTEFRRKDGTFVPVEIHSNYFEFEGEEYACGIIRDISERLKAEQELRETEERLRAFMNNYPAHIYIKDETGCHIYGNDAVLALTGRSLEDFVGTASQDFFPRDIAQRMEEGDRIALTEKMTTEIEYLAPIPDGDPRWFRDIKFPIPLGPDRVLVGGIAVDITALKRAEEELLKAYTEIKALKDHLEAENIYLRREIELNYRHEQIVGESHAIKSVLSKAEQVAPTESTVLLLGETGTGKELLAHAIHKMSARRERPMLTVNCAALPASLIESELFGREKGAYTGALTRQIGRFEVAHGSTIFLDEISELPLDLQTKLLRVLEDGRFERLGSSKTLTVDVRVIVAANKDLAEAVREGQFREDLYYRLNVFPIEVPPLRKRREDIPLLVWAFVKELGETMGKTVDYIPRQTMEALQRYSWPGNVRELKNVIERAMILSTGSTLHIDLPKSETLKLPRMTTLEEVERSHILDVLENTGWRIRGQNGAAAVLGLKPSTLESRMAKRGIKRPK